MISNVTRGIKWFVRAFSVIRWWICTDTKCLFRAFYGSYLVIQGEENWDYYPLKKTQNLLSILQWDKIPFSLHMLANLICFLQFDSVSRVTGHNTSVTFTVILTSKDPVAWACETIIFMGVWAGYQWDLELHRLNILKLTPGTLHDLSPVAQFSSVNWHSLEDDAFSLSYIRARWRSFTESLTGKDDVFTAHSIFWLITWKRVILLLYVHRSEV